VDARHERFIERMGLMTEADGLPRIAGRIFGYLLLTPGECSLEDIASALGVSRASVSNDARRLVQMGLLERRSRPGDRRDYYSMSTDAFRHSIEARIDSMRRFHGLIDEARGLVGEGEEVQQRLAAWDDAHRLLLTAFEGILADLEARAEGSTGSTTGSSAGGQRRAR
jgi:DNA-binding transcriptional regulator GbsR (MarR family)